MSGKYHRFSHLAFALALVTFSSFSSSAQEDSSSIPEKIPALQENLENNSQQQTPNYNHQILNPKSSIEVNPSIRDTSSHNPEMPATEDSATQSTESVKDNPENEERVEKITGSDEKLGKDAQGRELYQDMSGRTYFVEDGKRVYMPKKL